MDWAQEVSKEALAAREAARNALVAVKRLYEVVGNKIVGGATRGEHVEMTLTPDQERHLIDAGHIAPVVAPEPAAIPAPEVLTDTVSAEDAGGTVSPKTKKG